MESKPFNDFDSLAIVGLGLIGGSLAAALKRAGYSGRILGVSGAGAIEQALSQKAIDRGYPYAALGEAAASAQLVILATPIHKILEHLDELGRAGPRLRPGAIITDVGSTKRVILEKANAVLPRAVHFIGGHPMAGSEKRGFAAAEPFLFQNAYYVLTPSRGAPPEAVSKLGGFLGRTGARIVILEAEDHDRIAAAISHLPQLLAVALVNFLDELGPNREHAVHLAAGGFRDMTRIASSPYEIWRDILATNGKVAREVLEKFIHMLQNTAARIGKEEMGVLFDQAARTRSAIPRDSKGFIRPLWEILVVVEDRPGVIASIASVLARHQINIKDIEVIKVREDEGGSLRLAFSSLEVADQAIQLLSAEGFAVRLRQN